ncbi:MAG: ATP-binding cassette domain-containing protein [Corynebacterium sp.]|nr:ATP-binding cassette domain-containing protein [Corynebacterium sp.]
MGPAIVATGFGFRHSSRRAFAFQDVDFEIQRGEKVLLVGASGAGKSTLLHAIAGLLSSDQGETIGELRTNGNVGMVLQDPDAQVIAARVGDDVAFGCENLAMDPQLIRQRVPEFLDAVGLNFAWDHDTAHLSGGQQQRLALAGVLAMGADIICLDEPTANLDPAGVREVVHTISELTDATVVIVEHDIATWCDEVDRLVVLSSEGVIASGDPRTVLREHGKALAQLGIWVPGYAPIPPQLAGFDIHEVAVQTHALQLAWDVPGNQTPLELALPKGAACVLQGPNGVGKSSCLAALAGLVAPKAGLVEYPGIGRNPHQWAAPTLARYIGMVFQDPEVQFFQRSVGEEIIGSATVAFAKKFGRRDVHKHARLAASKRGQELLEQLGLAELAAANPFTLSGGQKRRLSVAGALVLRPEILFLDEPTFGQDRNNFITLVNLLAAAQAQGTTIVAVSHSALYRKALGQYVYDFAA